MKQAVNILLGILTGVFVTNGIWLIGSYESIAHWIFASMCIIGIIINR